MYIPIITGLHQARYSEGLVTFVDTMPEGLETETHYPAELIAAGSMGDRLRDLRGDNMTKVELAEESGVIRRTVQNVEANGSPAVSTAEKLFVAMGGKALFLTVYDPKNAESLVLAEPGTPTVLNQLFEVSYKKAGIKRPQVCKALGISIETLREFQEATWSRPDTVARYFDGLFGLQVGYCGIYDPSFGYLRGKLPTPESKS